MHNINIHNMYIHNINNINMYIYLFITFSENLFIVYVSLALQLQYVCKTAIIC